MRRRLRSQRVRSNAGYWDTRDTPNGVEIFADFISIRASELGELGIPLDFEEDLVSLRRYDLGNPVSHGGVAFSHACSS